MKYLIVFITVIVLVLTAKTATSQNEKLWEFNIWPKEISGMDFYDDSSICYTYNENGMSHFAVRRIIDTVVTHDIPLPFFPRDFRISREKNMIVFCTLDKIYYTDLDLENLDSIEVEEFKLEQVKEYEDVIDHFDVSFETNKIAIVQYLKNDGDSVLQGGQQYFSRLLIYDITTKQIVKRLGDIKSTFNLLKYSPNGKYLAVVDNHLFDHSDFVRLINTENYEEVDRIQHDKFDFGIGNISISPNNNFLSISSGLVENGFILYNIEQKKKILSKNEPILFSTLITDELVAYKDGFEGGIKVNILNGFQEIIEFPSQYVGLNLNYNENKKFLITRSSTIIMIALFDPSLLSVLDEEDNAATISPNPTTGILNISINNQYPAIFKYNLISGTGQIVLSDTLGFLDTQNNNLNINISQVPIGHYLLRISSDREEVTFNIIKE